ncbi:tetratricopeptide repeat protein [Pontibacter silvestris]|uniref:tetratricopeptide repeat protein n=1 Tax=Pontibacter silvestris TaxID=2305183 RepID=UPI00293F56CA|nr:DnaJ domain-containing protein [Pontibacter silvestris]
MNYYSILGISQTATSKEVKLAYKQLAIKYHPDKNPGNARAEELFKLINAAYQVLSNPNKRAQYDFKLHYQQQQRQIVRQQQPYYDTRYRQTRPPASVSERHYHKRRANKRFSKKDLYITLIFIAGILLFSFLLKGIMDYVTGEDKYETAVAYMEDGKYSSAHSLLSDAIRFMPNNAEPYEARASLELNVYENYKAALHDLNKAIALEEEPSAQAYYMRGQSLLQLTEYEKAEADLTYALELDKELWEAYLARGEVRLFYLNNYEDAIADLSAYLDHGSSSGKKLVDALTYRGFAYYKTAAFSAAERDYTRGLAEDKENGRLHYLLGRNQLRQQQQDSACVHFNKAYNLGYSAALLELRANCHRL